MKHTHTMPFMAENAILPGSRLYRQLPIKLQAPEKLMASSGNVLLADCNHLPIRRQLYAGCIVDKGMLSDSL